MIRKNMILAGLIVFASIAGATQQTSISQYGITWTFEKPATVGKFVNGDWWVVGPVKIASISPAPGKGRNGSTVHPRVSSKHGFDGRVAAFDPELFKAPPFDLGPGDSLISTISLDELTDKSYLRSAAVLTVVDAPQPVDTFRPPYTRPIRVPKSVDDPLRFTAQAIQWQLLPRLPRVKSTPVITNSAARLQRINMEHVMGWNQRNGITPIENPPCYGRDIALVVGEVSMQLMLDYGNDEKKGAMVNLLQYGIDLYGVLLDGGNWIADGGIYQGRKWPILFAGVMLDNHSAATNGAPAMRNIGARGLDAVGYKGPGYVSFQEDEQTFYVKAHPLGAAAPPGNEEYDIYTPPYQLHEYGWNANTYKAGSVKVTQGSPLVEGVGTLWKDAKFGTTSDGRLMAEAGFSFGVENDAEAYKVDGRAYKIKAVLSNTQLQLTEPYRGKTDQSGALSYKINPVMLVYGHGVGGKDEEYVEYSPEHAGQPNWGITYARDRNTGGLDWGKSYQSTCTGHSWGGYVLAAHLMEGSAHTRTLWNHPALFDYMDRYQALWKYGHQKGAGLNPPKPDQFSVDVPGFPEGGVNKDGSWPFNWVTTREGFLAEMWDSYRYRK